MAKLRLASEQVYRGHDPDDEHDRAERHPETQPFLDDGARLRPVAVEQKSQQIETDTAGDERQPDEHPEIVAGKARSNRHNLIGDRREALEQDDPGPPLRISLPKSIDLVAVTVKLDQPV